MKTSLALSVSALICLCVGTMFFLPPDARAEFYKYKDNSGAVVITDKLENVPKKYRGRVKVIWDDELEAKDPLARRMARAEKLRAERESRQKQAKGVEKKGGNEGKTLVVTYDEETGQVIRKFE